MFTNLSNYLQICLIILQICLQWWIQDFPEGRANSQSGCANHFFAKNCLKMKKFGFPGGVHPWHPLDPPMCLVILQIHLIVRICLISNSLVTLHPEV